MMHSALTYELLAQGQVLEPLSREQWLTMRKIVVDLILATDMGKHFEIMERFVAKYSGRILPFPEFDDRLTLYRICIKSADIAHAGKSAELHEKWTQRVVDEFFHQGDLEREQNLPISPFCDRFKADIPKDQKGFIQGVVKPLFVALNSVVQSETIDGTILAQLDLNIDYWRRRSERKKRCSLAPIHQGTEAQIVRAMTKVLQTEVEM